MHSPRQLPSIVPVPSSRQASRRSQARLEVLPNELKLHIVSNIPSHVEEGLPVASVLESRRAEAETLISLSQVSQDWRSIVLASDKVWGHSLDIDRGNATFFQETLHRSKARDIVIYSELTLENDLWHRTMHPKWELLFKQFHRVKVLHLAVGPDFDCVILSKILARDAPNLESLRVDRAQGSNQHPWSLPRGLVAPNLRYLSLTNCVLSSFTHATSKVSSLCFSGNVDSLHTFYHALVEQAGLENLSIAGHLGAGKSKPSRGWALPKLKTLRLDLSRDDAQHFLNSMNIPFACEQDIIERNPSI